LTRGKRKEGGNKRKEVESRRDRREKKKAKTDLTGPGEEKQRRDWIMDTGGTRGCYPWART
jgi:hypothetical protein